MKNNFFIVSLIIMLTGCVNITTPSPVPASTTPSITNTVLPTLTPLPFASPRATPDPRFARRCVQVEGETVSLRDITSGTILLFADLVEDQPFLLDIQSGQNYILPTEVTNPDFLGAHVSPDGTKFAYVEGIVNSEYRFDGGILWVVNAHAEVLAKLKFDEGLGNNLRWLDNDRVIFYIDQTSVDGTVMVVNPFTGEQQLIFNELPNLLTGDLSWDVNWRVEYSPNLDWVAYLGSTKHAWGGSPIIRDTMTGQMIWQAESESNWDMPVWSPNGSEVAVIVGNDLKPNEPFLSELFLIDRSGQTRSIYVEGRKQAFAPSWSPDGSRIAFWNDQNLMIYDLLANQTIDLCVRNEWTRQNAAVWSPNSRYLGVDKATANPAESYSLLIDLQKGIGYKPIEAQGVSYPDIWMNSIP